MICIYLGNFEKCVEFMKKKSCEFFRIVIGAPLLPEVGASFNVRVSHAPAASAFYVQPLSTYAELGSMMSRLKV